LGNTTLESAGSCDYLSAKIVRSIVSEIRSIFSDSRQISRSFNGKFLVPEHSTSQASASQDGTCQPSAGHVIPCQYMPAHPMMAWDMPCHNFLPVRKTQKGRVFCFKNSGGTARYPVTLPPVHTATNIDWHYITPWHILKNTPL
jgi:hypothetical protein